ncbi:hypothetical protein PWE32_42860, partial [Streptomyces neyagawaensis]
EPVAIREANSVQYCRSLIAVPSGKIASAIDPLLLHPGFDFRNLKSYLGIYTWTEPVNRKT